LFDGAYGVKHYLGHRIILLPETNGALEPHDPSRSCPKRDAHGFVFAVGTVFALTVVIVATATPAVVAALVIAVAVVLWDRDNLLDHCLYHR
jgi:hypothetical protein